MKSKHHIIYVPGILDDVYYAQNILVKFWIIFGVHGHCHPMPWAGSGKYEPKLSKLLDHIDKYLNQGHHVSLVGASAGASAVINAYTERNDKIESVALICAKINAPETVSEHTYKTNPAFKTSMYTLQDNLNKLKSEDKVKITNFYTPTDKTVPYSATTYPGIKEVKLPNLRHGQAIIYSLSIGSRRLIKNLRRA